MPRNQKLIKVIAGRTIKVATVEAGSVLVLFDDQSSMKIKTAGSATIPAGGKVKSVHEAKLLDLWMIFPYSAMTRIDTHRSHTEPEQHSD